MDIVSFESYQKNSGDDGLDYGSELSFLNLLGADMSSRRFPVVTSRQSFKSPAEEQLTTDLALSFVQADFTGTHTDADASSGKTGSGQKLEYYTDPNDVVEILYQRLFQRGADPGSKWAADLLKAGVPYKDVVKAAIDNQLQEFKKSIPEHQADLVPFLYMRLLNRKERPTDEEMAGWKKLLVTNGLDAVVNGILEAPEFKQNSPTLLQPNDFPILGLDMLPSKFSLENSRVRIEDNLARVAKKLPVVPKVLEDLAGAIEFAEVNASEHAIELKARGRHQLEIETPDAGKVAIAMKDPVFQIVFDQRDRNKLKITNIVGAETSLGRLTGINLELATNGEGKPVLRMQVIHAQAAKNQVAVFDVLETGIRAAANNRTFDVVLDEKAAQVAKQFMTYGKKWSEVKDLFQLLRVLGDQAELPLVHQVLKDVVSVKRSGDSGERLELTQRGARTVEIGGGLALSFDEKIQLKLSREVMAAGLADTAVKLSDIGGISARLPLPEPVLKQLGMPEQARLSEVKLSEQQPDGTRLLTLRTVEHGTISLAIGTDGRPVLRNGELSVDVSAIFHGKQLPLTVKFNPQKAAVAGPIGPDFSVAFKGDADGLGEILQKVVGGNLGPADQLARGLKEIKKVGDQFTIIREQPTSSAYNGLVVDAAQQIEFKVEFNKGLILKDIKGINYKMMVDLGWLSDAFDLGRETKPTTINLLKVSDPDAQGQQSVVLKGEGPFAAVRVDIKDGKIATNPSDDNRGTICALLTQYYTDEERTAGKPPAYIALALKVDSNGKLKMTSAEKRSAFAETLYMVANKDKFRGN